MPQHSQSVYWETQATQWDLSLRAAYECFGVAHSWYMVSQLLYIVQYHTLGRIQQEVYSNSLSSRS